MGRMFQASLVVVTGLTLLGGCNGADRPPAAPGHSSPAPDGLSARIDAFVEPFVDLAMFDGTILIEQAGETLFKKSYGFSNHELGVRHDADTRFRIASVSKTVTDVAVARLVQEGRLELDAPLARFLPDFPAAETIRVRQLLDYTSGIAHTNSQPWGDGSRSLTLDEIVARLAKLPLDFEPGSDRRYSNGGYAVAARVVEVVSGSSYGEAMEELVFAPLGMTTSGHLDDARRVIPGMATGYEPGPAVGERRHARFYAAETRPGGGSLYSTARDLLRFARGVFRDGFVRDDLLASVLGHDEPVFLGQGRSPGFVCKLMYDSEHDRIVVSVANSYAVPDGWAATLADLAAEGGGTASWLDFEVSRSGALDRSLEGRYENSFGGELVVERSDDGTLVVLDSDRSSATALVPLTDGGFLMPLYFQRCEQAAGGEVNCRILSGNPRYDSSWTPLPSRG